ncbi:MAG: hypothetical protein R3F62_09420 [Planctomycetota bacterium]
MIQLAPRTPAQICPRCRAAVDAEAPPCRRCGARLHAACLTEFGASCPCCREPLRRSPAPPLRLRRPRPSPLVRATEDLLVFGFSVSAGFVAFVLLLALAL